MQIILKFFRYLFRIKSSNNKIVQVLLFHKLGDTVFTIPALKYIKELYPGYVIYVCCYNETMEILKYYFNDISFLSFPKKSFYIDRIPSISVIKKNYSIKPAALYDITGRELGLILTFFSSAKNKIGINKVYYRIFYDRYVERRKKPHLMDLYLDIVKDGNLIYNSETYFPANYSTSDPILIHPFGGWQAKEWGFEKFIGLYQELEKKYKCKLIIPMDQMNNERSNFLYSKGIDYLVTNSVVELIKELEKCSLLIGNDSGPIYIASMLGKATYTIYGPTNPIYSIPHGDHHQYIRKMLDCSPVNDNQYCNTIAGLYCPSYECMIQLQQYDVKKDLLNFINKLELKSKEVVM